VSQKRIAQIENAPEVTSFDQIVRLVAALGARIIIEISDQQTTGLKKKPKDSRRKSAPHTDW
jgi:hypothetical protein